MPAADGTIAEIISDLARSEPTYNMNGLLEPGGGGFDYYPITPLNMAIPLFRGSGLVRSADPTAYGRARGLGARLVWIADDRAFPHSKFANQAAADAYFGPRWDALAAQPGFDPQYVIVDVTNEPDSNVATGGIYWSGTIADFCTHWLNCYTCIQHSSRANGLARFSGPNTASYRGTVLLNTANPPVYQDPAANIDDWIFTLMSSWGGAPKRMPVVGWHTLARDQDPDIVRHFRGEAMRYMQHWLGKFPFNNAVAMGVDEFQSHEVVSEGFTSSPFPAWPNYPWHRSPGQSLLTHRRFELAKFVTGTCIACWNKPSDETGVGAELSDCTMGNLFGLLHPTSLLPRPRWWAYKVYADGWSTRVWSSVHRIPSDNVINYNDGGVAALCSLTGGNTDATSYLPGPYPLDIVAIGQAEGTAAAASSTEWGNGIVRRTIKNVRKNPRLAPATSVTVLKRRLRHIPGGAAGGQTELASETVPIVGGDISYTIGSVADYAKLHDAYANVLTAA